MPPPVMAKPAFSEGAKDAVAGGFRDGDSGWLIQSGAVAELVEGP